MNRTEIERTIREEVAEWPGATVEFENGGKHPKMKLQFGDLIMRRAFSIADNPVTLIKGLGDVRRTLKQMGAARAADPTKEADEAVAEKVYHARNRAGVDARPDPVAGDKAEPKLDLVDQLVSAGAVTAEDGKAARDAIQAAGSAATYERAAALRRALPPAAAEGPPESVAALLLQLEACGITITLVGEIALGALILTAAEAVVDGIYFGLPEEVYHAVPRLSSSGLQRMCVSPANFWRGSWLDPERAEKFDEEATKARIVGKAYHCARLEPEAFEARFVRELTPADFPSKGFLSSDEKVKAALKEAGAQQTVSGETMSERAERLLDTGYEGTIFPLEKARWAAKVNGRTPLPAEVYDDIARDMDRLRANKDIASLLSDGAAEVSVFYTDENGIKMKSRLDWLAAGWWVDFKTFENSRRKPLMTAIADAFRYDRYYIQAPTYREAVEAIRIGGLQIVSAATDEQRKLIAQIQIRPDELACWYVFQEKKGVPNLLAFEFMFYDVPLSQELQIMLAEEAGFASPEAAAAVRGAVRNKSQIFERGLADIAAAKHNFMLYSQVYADGGPWFPLRPRGQIDDYLFNSYWLEGKA
jgi:hypothetical protein